MSFPVNSTAVETDQIERVVRVLQRAKIRKAIAYGAVFACRKIANSISWSQHAWGNGLDIFPKGTEYAEKRARCHAIADAVVNQTKRKTAANLGRRLPVAEVIDHENRRIWTKSGGWAHYGGNTGLHVHVSGDPLRTGTPPCA